MHNPESCDFVHNAVTRCCKACGTAIPVFHTRKKHAKMVLSASWRKASLVCLKTGICTPMRAALHPAYMVVSTSVHRPVMDVHVILAESNA